MGLKIKKRILAIKKRRKKKETTVINLKKRKEIKIAEVLCGDCENYFYSPEIGDRFKFCPASSQKISAETKVKCKKFKGDWYCLPKRQPITVEEKFPLGVPEISKEQMFLFNQKIAVNMCKNFGHQDWHASYGVAPDCSIREIVPQTGIRRRDECKIIKRRKK